MKNAINADANAQRPEGFRGCRQASKAFPTLEMSARKWRSRATRPKRSQEVFDGNWMRVYGEAWNSRDRVAAVRQMGAQGRTRLK
jgi:hypothetical protein